MANRLSEINGEEHKREIERFEEYRRNILETLGKNQEAFEKQLSYVSSGGIGVSLLFFDNIVDSYEHSNFKGLLLTGWILLASVLFVNLCSQLISEEFHRRTYNDVYINGPNYDYESATKRGRIIGWINLSCVVMLFVGILLIILYFYNN